MRDNFGVILLCAGKGTRMESDTPKQYLNLKGHPVLYYSLKEFEDNANIDDIVLVVSEDYKEYVAENIVKKYGFKKVSSIVIGGNERYQSVYNGLSKMAEKAGIPGVDDENGDGSLTIEYVMIHDGARPFVTQDMIDRLVSNVKLYGACIPAIPSKDTVCISDENGFIESNPDRAYIWNAQTPQTFDLIKFKKAFDSYMELKSDSERSIYKKNNVPVPDVTDDAMVWKMFRDEPIKIVLGDYNNMKITEPSDLKIAKAIRKFYLARMS